MSTDGKYNGYANYQTWNVCVWIANDEKLYNIATTCADYSSFIKQMRMWGYLETPDNVAYNDSGVSLAEMQEFWAENFSKVCA